MNARFLEYYNRELSYLRELGGEFARDFPKIAGRLGLDAFECADPYVERLLEGFAFLAARIQIKIDAEYPRFSEQLIDLLYPNYLAPTPSMAVVHFQPDPRQGALNSGFVVPRGTALTSNIRRGESTACQYRTAQDVTLWPIEITSLVHTPYTNDLEQPSFRPRRPIKGALRLGLRSTNGLPFSDFRFERLGFFIRGNDSSSLRLFELLVSGSEGILLRQPKAMSALSSSPGSVRTLGLDEAESLLPAGHRALHGYRLLHEYFAFPSRFLFVELTDLGPGVLRCKGEELEIVIALDRLEASLESAVTSSHMDLFCTPAINLFPKSADRIHVTTRDHEYQVVADRTRPMDYEVHSVRAVASLGTNAADRRELAPLYHSHVYADPSTESAFFTVHRRHRLASSRRQAQGPQSGYLGGDVFVALVDDREAPFRSDFAQLAVDTLCTNRDLPLRMEIGEGRTDFVVGSGAPVVSVRCVAGPSPPHPSRASGAMCWRFISHLSLNYLMLTDSADGRGAEALRDLLRLYEDISARSSRRQVEGVRSSAVRSAVRRLHVDGFQTFARGVEVTLECEEAAFEGTSAFLLGSVLERFFARYVSSNSFTETVLRSVERGEVARWPLRIGQRRSI